MLGPDPQAKKKILKSNFPVCFDIGSIETIVEKHLRPHAQVSKQGEQQQQVSEQGEQQQRPAEHKPRATSQHGKQSTSHISRRIFTAYAGSTESILEFVLT